MSGAPFHHSTTPEQLLVQGAGVEAVNGVYSLVSFYDNTGLFNKVGEWDGESVVFSLYRYSTNESWYISIVGRDETPTSLTGETDFYRVNQISPVFNIPPSEEWIVSGIGWEPAPTVTRKSAPTLHEREIPMTSVIRPFALAHEKMLLSDDFSDVKLVCKDNVVLPAHRCVLAASSSYFNAAFAGPWKENETGELKVDYASTVMKAVLKMMYTGVVSSDVVRDDPVPFLNIAAEYDLPWLKVVAETNCSESIDESNLKSVWQAARTYESDMLKDCCVEYAKNNLLEVFVNGAAISSLKTEDPTSWDEFSSRIRKKARSE